MARFGMVIDTTRCVGCMDCVVACNTENRVPDGFNRDWITTQIKGKLKSTFAKPCSIRPSQASITSPCVGSR